MTTMFRREKPRTFKKDSGGQSIQNRHTSPKKFFYLVWFFCISRETCVATCVHLLFCRQHGALAGPYFYFGKKWDDFSRWYHQTAFYSWQIWHLIGFIHRKKPPIYTPQWSRQVLTLYSLTPWKPWLSTRGKVVPQNKFANSSIRAWSHSSSFLC